jgi:2,4-dienoyl-CoA reductase-like NADH-dependent reductase (Old Yellow Enzyme family)
MFKLFEKTWINSMEIPNRFVRSATWSGIADENGYVRDFGVEFYRKLGSGDLGFIISGYQYVMTNGIQLPFMVGNYTDDQVDGLSRLASAVHASGGRLVVQLVHAGSLGNPELFKDGDLLWGPSAIPHASGQAVPVEMTVSDIRTLVEAYSRAAARSVEAGVDGIQLHGAHGYGINQFLSPYWNRRGDSYGGHQQGRYRLLGEILEAVRAAVGPDIPVMIKINAHDFLECGLLPDETISVCRRLTDDGIDAIEVSGGSSASGKKQGPVRKGIARIEDEGYFVEFARAVRESVSVPVIAVGGVRSFQKASDIVSENKADYVSMSRPLIREPHLVCRWKSGDLSRATCISCNGCFETGIKGLGISCKVDRKLRDRSDENA